VQYHSLLTAAAKQTCPLKRLAHVAVFACTPYATSVKRLQKPFNPILGETYEVSHLGYRMIAEQVSHHPPVSAYHVIDDNHNFTLWGSCHGKIKFTGTTVEVKVAGWVRLRLRTCDGWEEYVWGRPITVVHNIIFGGLWMEWVGMVSVRNCTRRQTAMLEFMRRTGGMFTKASPLHQLRGEVRDETGTPHYVVGGCWSQHIWVQTVNARQPSSPDSGGSNRPYDVSYDPPTTGLQRLDGVHHHHDHEAHAGPSTALLHCGKSDDSFANLDDSPPVSPSGLRSKHKLTVCLEQNSPSPDPRDTLVEWRPAADPPNSCAYFNFTSVAMELNEVSPDYDPKEGVPVPITDSRFRTDQRLYEEGRVNEAQAEKRRLEEKQRAARKARIDEWQPRWFERRLDPIVSKKEPTWQLRQTPSYWDKKRDYADLLMRSQAPNTNRHATMGHGQGGVFPEAPDLF